MFILSRDEIIRKQFKGETGWDANKKMIQLNVMRFTVALYCTFILSMLASILSCCTVRRAWLMLLELWVFEDILRDLTLQKGKCVNTGGNGTFILHIQQISKEI